MSNQAAEDSAPTDARARPITSASRAVQLPQPGFQPQAFFTCLVELAPAETQSCTSSSETALQIQMYTVASTAVVAIQ
ncbi:hypothetical protein [Nocardia sp. NBC_00565]|uniref:hypothetical protein n=1 Tax=Nocardia sp. NBC_00565 TaxID=2975993 RepID=UPI003FA5D7C1